MLTTSVVVKDLRLKDKDKDLMSKDEDKDEDLSLGLGPALIQTCYGTEHEVMSLVVYCRCHVTDKQLSALDIKDIRDSYGLLAVTRMSSSTQQANISLT